MSDAAPAGYWDLLEPYWEQIDIYNGPERFLATFGAAPPVVRTLFAAHFCESEVSNGGLHQFFMNPTGVLAPEAVQAFRAIDFHESAAILERAMQLFGAPYPRDADMRIQLLEKVSDPFTGLDDEFDSSLGLEHEPFFDALDKFVGAGGGKATSG